MSFIGVYQEDIIVSNLPFTFPKLCFSLNYSKVQGGASIVVSFQNPSGKELANPPKFVLPNDLKSKNKLIMTAALVSLKVEEEGEYRLVVTYSHGEKKNDEEIKINILLPPSK
jgi:hypothetical protein